MLKTPLGEIVIIVDGQSVTYKPISLDCTEYGTRNEIMFTVDARYKIEVKLSSIPCVVECKFNDFLGDDGRGGVDSGQYLALICFYRGNTKLSIGVEDEIPGVECSYTDYGLKVELTEQASIHCVTFGIAWVAMKDEEKEDIYTWFAADPTLYEC
jgi:hypothetical protein